MPSPSAVSYLHQPGHVSWSAVIQAMLGLERAYLLHHSRSEQSFLEGVGLSHSGWQLPRVLFHCSRILRRLNSPKAAAGVSGWMVLVPGSFHFFQKVSHCTHWQRSLITLLWEGRDAPTGWGLSHLAPQTGLFGFFVRNELGRRQWVNRALPLPAFLTSSACTAWGGPVASYVGITGSPLTIPPSQVHTFILMLTQAHSPVCISHSHILTTKWANHPRDGNHAWHIPQLKRYALLHLPLPAP